MKKRWRGKEITRSKEKREIIGKGGKLGIMEYVSVRYWQPYRLAPLKMSWPHLASPLKKAGTANATL